MFFQMLKYLLTIAALITGLVASVNSLNYLSFYVGEG